MTSGRRLNVDRMRKRVSIPRPAPQPPEEDDSVVVRDAVGRIIRVLPARRDQ